MLLGILRNLFKNSKKNWVYFFSLFSFQINNCTIIFSLCFCFFFKYLDWNKIAKNMDKKDIEGKILIINVS